MSFLNYIRKPNIISLGIFRGEKKMTEKKKRETKEGDWNIFSFFFPSSPSKYRK